MLIRQGDVNMRRLGDAVCGIEDTRYKQVCLATGGTSDHAHTLLGVPVSPGVIDVPHEAPLLVQNQKWRHTSIVVPPGRYKFWSPIELTENEEREEIQTVTD